MAPGVDSARVVSRRHTGNHRAFPRRASWTKCGAELRPGQSPANADRPRGTRLDPVFLPSLVARVQFEIAWVGWRAAERERHRWAIADGHPRPRTDELMPWAFKSSAPATAA